MEAAYYYESSSKEAVENLLADDFFKRIGPVDREAKLMGSKRTSGFYFYVKADNPETFKEAIKRIEESKVPFQKLSGDEEQLVFNAIHEEEEASASGMGAIFG